MSACRILYLCVQYAAGRSQLASNHAYCTSYARVTRMATASAFNLDIQYCKTPHPTDVLQDLSPAFFELCKRMEARIADLAAVRAPATPGNPPETRPTDSAVILNAMDVIKQFMAQQQHQGMANKHTYAYKHVCKIILGNICLKKTFFGGLYAYKHMQEGGFRGTICL
jgi:hypothetical protein